MMKKQEEEGKELLTGIKSNRLSDIRDQIIVGGGDKLREIKQKMDAEKKNRLDERTDGE